MDKEKVRKALGILSTPEEKDDFHQLELQLEVVKKLEQLDKELKVLLRTLVLNSKESTAKLALTLTENQKEQLEAVAKTLTDIKNKLPQSIINEIKKLPEYPFGTNITVSKEPPPNPKPNDLWVEIR